MEATGGGTPELLLAFDGSDTTPVIVFTIGEDGKVRASTDMLVMGAPGNGGGRLAVWASASGNGVYQISGSSMGKELTSERFTLDGTSPRVVRRKASSGMVSYQTTSSSIGLR